MAGTESSNPAFQVVREAGALQVTVPVKTERFRTLLSLVWLLVWAAALPPLLGSSDPLAGPFLAAFTLAGGVVLWRWLWRVGGRETFRVAGDTLVARRGVWGIGRSRTFDLRKIKSVKAGRLLYQVVYPSWGRMFIGHDESEVLIDGRAYGKGLEDAEASALVGLLEEEIWLRTRDRSFAEARLLARV